jgi:hypothetical protein
MKTIFLQSNSDRRQSPTDGGIGPTHSPTDGGIGPTHSPTDGGIGPTQ